MTAVKIENIKCGLNENENWKCRPIKVKCECDSAQNSKPKIALERKELYHETVVQPTKYSRPPPKTPAERKRAQRAREKQLRLQLGLISVKRPPKSAAERKRAQREREKQMRMHIGLLFPKQLEKIPGESRKQRAEREKQLKIELGLISPKGPPKTPAERKRAQREREKQMKLEVGMTSSQMTGNKRSLSENPQIRLQRPSTKNGTIQDYRERKHQKFRKELIPLSANTPNLPIENKMIGGVCCKNHILRSKFATGENIKPGRDLEFVDCGKSNSIDNPSDAYSMEEISK